MSAYSLVVGALRASPRIQCHMFVASRSSELAQKTAVRSVRTFPSLCRTESNHFVEQARHLNGTISHLGLSLFGVKLERQALGQQFSARNMAYDSSNKTQQRIDGLIKKGEKRVFVFMKGVPAEPLCRYSGVVAQILNAYGIDYDSFNVLEDEDIRREIKAYSDWPTIPQVFVDKEFVGGCDVMLEMHQSGELAKMFGDGPTHSTPS